MVLVAIGWLYVVLMVAVVEAASPQGSVLGAAFTLLLYGVLPLAIIAYLYFSPARRRARRRAQPEMQGSANAAGDTPSSGATGLDPDQRGHPAGDPIAPKREEP